MVLGCQGATSWSCFPSWADSGFGRRVVRVQPAGRAFPAGQILGLVAGLLGCNQLVLLSQLGRFWVWSRAWNRQSVRHPRMSDSKVDEDEGS